MSSSRGKACSSLARQLFQFLFILISFLAVVASTVAIKGINESGSAGTPRVISYVGLGVTYLVVAVVISRVIPGNPDVTPNWVPSALVIMFRTFTIIGHFLLWAVISLGVVGYIKYKDSGIKAEEPAIGRVAVG